MLAAPMALWDYQRGYGRIRRPLLSTWLGLLLALSRVWPGANVVRARCDPPPHEDLGRNRHPWAQQCKKTGWKKHTGVPFLPLKLWYFGRSPLQLTAIKVPGREDFPEDQDEVRPRCWQQLRKHPAKGTWLE